MAHHPPQRPEWLPLDSESGSDNGTFENNREVDEALLGSGVSPEWLHPPDKKAQAATSSQGGRQSILSEWASTRSSSRGNADFTEASSLRGGSDAGSEYGGVESASGQSVRSAGGGSRRKTGKRGGKGGSSRRLRVGKSAGPGRDRLRLLEYKAGRPCCLTLLGVLHCATTVSALLAGAAMALDVYAIYLNSTTLEPHKALSFNEFWGLLQSVMLRLYGVVFTGLVVVTELSEFELCAKCMAKLHDNAVAQHWWARGLAYVFVGLFALESGREVVTLDDDQLDVSPVGSAAGFGASGGASNAAAPGSTSSSASPSSSAMLDDSRALVVIRSGGTLLMAAGFLYTFLGVLCCKALKELQVKDLNRARGELASYVEFMAEGNNGGGGNGLEGGDLETPTSSGGGVFEGFTSGFGFQRGGGDESGEGSTTPNGLLNRFWPPNSNAASSAGGQMGGSSGGGSGGGASRKDEEWPTAHDSTTKGLSAPLPSPRGQVSPQTELQRRYSNLSPRGSEGASVASERRVSGFDIAAAAAEIASGGDPSSSSHRRTPSPPPYSRAALRDEEGGGRGPNGGDGDGSDHRPSSVGLVTSQRVAAEQTSPLRYSPRSVSGGGSGGYGGSGGGGGRRGSGEEEALSSERLLHFLGATSRPSPTHQNVA